MKQQNAEQTKQLFKKTAGFLLGMILLWFTGCAVSDGVPRRLEADYGRSVTNARLEQMVTPPNAVDTSPPVGIAPQTADNIRKSYDKTFEPKKEEQKTILQLAY
jgi:hypothetical protein